MCYIFKINFFFSDLSVQLDSKTAHSFYHRRNRAQLLLNFSVITNIISSFSYHMISVFCQYILKHKGFFHFMTICIFFLLLLVLQISHFILHITTCLCLKVTTNFYPVFLLCFLWQSLSITLFTLNRKTPIDSRKPVLICIYQIYCKCGKENTKDDLFILWSCMNKSTTTMHVCVQEEGFVFQPGKAEQFSKLSGH